MSNKQIYQKPESAVILIETEGDISVIVTSGGSPSETKTPSLPTNSFFKDSGSILKGDD